MAFWKEMKTKGKSSLIQLLSNIAGFSIWFVTHSPKPYQTGWKWRIKKMEARKNGGWNNRLFTCPMSTNDWRSRWRTRACLAHSRAQLMLNGLFDSVDLMYLTHLETFFLLVVGRWLVASSYTYNGWLHALDGSRRKTTELIWTIITCRNISRLMPTQPHYCYAISFNCNKMFISRSRFIWQIHGLTENAVRTIDR